MEIDKKNLVSWCGVIFLGRDSDNSGKKMLMVGSGKVGILNNLKFFRVLGI